MSFAAMAILLPLCSALPLAFLGRPMQGAYANLIVSCVGFLLALVVGYAPGSGLLHADGLGILFGMLSGFVGLTTAVQNIAFIRAEVVLKKSERRLRMYHAMFQLVLGTILLGLYADNIGLLWVAVEGATIAMAVGVGLAGTPNAVAAAWKYFVLSAAGLVLALFGTLLTYLAAQPALGPGLSATSLVALSANAAHLNGALLSLAFVFLLFGYGTKAALVPLHGWLPDACAEGPVLLTACLNGLQLNVALLAILRFRHLMAANFAAGGGAIQPAGFLITFGLASIVLTPFLLRGERNVRRFFGFSSIQQSGIAVFAFGIGGAAAIFGGLLQMILHTLIKSAVWQALISSAALQGGVGPDDYGFSHLRGMPATNKYLGWLLGFSVFALVGLPPSGLFCSEFLIIGQTVQRQPWLALPFGFGLVLGGVAIVRKIGRLIVNSAPAAARPAAVGWDIGMIGLSLGLMFCIAYAMPPVLVHALSKIAVTLQ